MKITIYEKDSSRQLDLTMFGKEIISFGRHPECDIRIDKEFVSRVHGCFYYDGKQWYVQDMESTFGIYLNNKKVAQSPIGVGDVITIFSPGNEAEGVRIDISGVSRMDVVDNQVIPDDVNTVMYSENMEEMIPDFGQPWELKRPDSGKQKKSKKSLGLKIGVSIVATILLILGVVFAVKTIGNDKKSNNDSNQIADKKTETTTEIKTTEEKTTEVTTEELIPPELEYRAYVQSYGWKNWCKNGEISGTVGESKRLEALDIRLTESSYEGEINYITYVQGSGWQGKPSDISTWKKNGETSGTTEQAKRVEAVCISLTGELADKFDIYYRVHVQSYGWMAWCCNGSPAGTVNYSKSIESIQLALVEKGEIPADDYCNVTTVYDEPYVERVISEEEYAYYKFLSDIESNASGRVDGGIYLNHKMSFRESENCRQYVWFYIIADMDNNGKNEMLIYYEDKFIKPDGTDDDFDQGYRIYEYDSKYGEVVEISGDNKFDIPGMFTFYNNGMIGIGEGPFSFVGIRASYLYDLGIMNDANDPTGTYKECYYPINYTSDGTNMQINGFPGSDFVLIREVTQAEGDKIFSFINPNNVISVTQHSFTRENIEKIIGN
ncbi:MAG: FHA domain-containing protein [Lachnospiraceae bacterium]|nr:FHA domain-containing protein [Lachnospiraceae bacterium]